MAAPAPRPRETGTAGTPSLPDQVVNSALRYRAQAPVVDALLREVGMSSVDAGAVGEFLKSGLQRGSDTPDAAD